MSTTLVHRDRPGSIKIIGGEDSEWFGIRRAGVSPADVTAMSLFYANVYPSAQGGPRTPRLSGGHGLAYQAELKGMIVAVATSISHFLEDKLVLCLRQPRDCREVQ
jgi:hypothetical protein